MTRREVGLHLGAVKFKFDADKILPYRQGMSVSELDVEKPRYHHGDLRAALLRAAETELEENGIEAFSLRKVAKRAGVSHAAPAHHFGDVGGLLTALAVVGNRRFIACMADAEQNATEAEDRLICTCVGYIDFAIRHHALFRLIFASDKVDRTNHDLVIAGRDAFAHLADRVHLLRGVHPSDDETAMMDAMAIWATSHGIADLFSSGRMQPIQKLDAAEQLEAIKSLLKRTIPITRDRHR